MHAINNRNYLELSGEFTGSVETTFEVLVTGANSEEQWAYRTKDTDEDGWSDYSTAVDIDVGNNKPSTTPLQLGTTGVYITFTRPEADDYQADDVWSWSSAISLKLDDVEGTFNYIETIDVGETRNLLAISQGSGRIATIENIDGDNPIAQPSDSLINLGATNGRTLDFEKRNKEIYIAKGAGYPPQWLGYTKNGGWAGEQDSSLKCVPALDVLTGSDNPETDAFDMSVVLRAGGGANLSSAKVIVGIKTDGEARQEDKIWVQNLPDKKLYDFGCQTAPIAIKRWYGIEDGSYCDGFAVMRKAADAINHCVDIDLWNCNTGEGTYAGQQANLYNTIHIEKPEAEDTDSGLDVGYYSDFLIVPKISDMQDDDQRWTILLSRRAFYTPNFSEAKRKDYSWLWTTGELTRTQMDSVGYTISASGLESITPRLFNPTANPHDRPHGEMYYMVEEIHAGNDVSVILGGQTYQSDMPDYVPIHASTFSEQGIIPVFQNTSKYCLEFAGFNSETGGNGASPIIYFTIATQPPDSRGSRAWYSARQALTANQRQINSYPYATESGEASGVSAWNQPIFGPFMGDNNSNATNKVYRGVKWITYAMHISDDNEGESVQKAFCHMIDYNIGGTRTTKWRSATGNSGFNIPQWLLPGGLGELGTANKGIMQWDNIPSAQPNFLNNGRIIASTTGATRQRALLSYVRGGNRKLLHFRFGTETAKPQEVSGPTKPQLFPNDWSIDAYTEFEGELYETAYTWWNTDQDGDPISQSITPTSGGTGFYGSSANSGKMKKGYYLTASANPDDKGSYRAAEHGNIVQHSTTNQGQTDTYWWMSSASVTHVMSVPWGDHQVKQLFKVGQATATNTYTSSASKFSMQPPTETGTEGSWAGISCAKVFYKASLIYDGYQETALISTTGSFWEESSTAGVGEPITKTMAVEMRISDGMVLNDRVTGVAVYRATSLSKDTLEPETLYRFIQEIPLYQFNHNASGSYQSFNITDTGDAEGTYEAVNGMSEKIFDMSISYGVNTQQNGYHFVGDCNHQQIPDAQNYLFRSQPGKFSLFDWTKDFVQLPFIPVALRGFMGKVYAFSNSQVAVVNPNNLFIEDVIEGTGCINSKTIAITDSGMMWCDYRNIYLASPSMKPIGDAILNVESYGWLNIPTDNKDTVRCGYDSKRKAFLIFFAVTINETEEYRCWCYSTQKNRWDLFSTPEKVFDTALTKDGATILLLKDNTLAKFLSNTGTREDWSWESKKIQMGQTMVDKKVRNLKVEGNDRTLTTIQYKLDGDTAWKTGSNISNKFTGDDNLAFTLQTGDKSKKVHWIKLKIDGDNTTAGTDIKAYATSLIYKAKRPK